jgi:aldehyde dehydrogenase (NAD(P)+)
VSVYAATTEDVNSAVKAARRALNDPSWKDLSGLDRGKLMHRLANLIEANRETLATIETMDNGKPYLVALNEDLTETAETIRYYAGFADKVFGQVISTTPEKFAYTIREPVGVCGQIIP